MEKFNKSDEELENFSDEDSVKGENDLLYNFLFAHHKQTQPNGSSEQLEASLAPSKEGFKHQKNAQKNSKMSIKPKKGLNGQKRDTESPYRKVVVTTDLRSDPKQRGKRGPKGGLGTSSFFSLLDWDISSAAQPHVPKDFVQPQLQNGTTDGVVHGGKTLQLRSGLFGSRFRNRLLRKRARVLSNKRISSIKMQKSTQPRVFACHLESCGKIFNDRASLKKHLTVHGDKLFQCPNEGCGKKFLDNAKLKRHMLVHTGEKPYQCDLCGKKFSLDFNLKTHLRIHTGEKPFSCSFKNCHKRFNQKSNLHAHMLTHHLQDSNGEPLIFHQGPHGLYLNNSSFSSAGRKLLASGYDHDNSFSSERQKQSKLEKLEMEINRLMEKNDGKLFIVKYERIMRDESKGMGYYSNEEGYGYGAIRKPLFKIKMKPRNCCNLHQEMFAQKTVQNCDSCKSVELKPQLFKTEVCLENSSEQEQQLQNQEGDPDDNLLVDQKLEKAENNESLGENTESQDNEQGSIIGSSNQIKQDQDQVMAEVQS